MFHSRWHRTNSKVCCASFPFPIQFFKVLGYELSTKMWAMPVRAPTSCQVPIFYWAQEYELYHSLSLPSSSQLYLLSLRAPCTALRSSFIYECILLNCVCRRTSQPLPCQWSGTMLLKRLWFSRSTGESDRGRSYACLTPADICESALLPAKETHLGDGVKTAPLYRHHRRPLRWIDDFRHKTTRNTPKCVFHVPQNVKVG